MICQERSVESKLCFFPVVIYRCETWTIKKAEHRRTGTFEQWYWRRPESPLDCKKIKAINLKEMSPDIDANS